MSKETGIWLGIGAVVALFGFVIWYEITVWRHCLQTDPWWYCLKVLGR